MADITTTISITLTVATRAMSLSRDLALRETSQVSIAASDGATFPAGKTYHLVAIHDGTMIASNSGLTNTGATLTGEIDFNTEEAIEAFGTEVDDMPDLYPVVLELWNATDGLKLGLAKIAVKYNPYSSGMSTPTTGAITDYLTEASASQNYLTITAASNTYEPHLGSPAATGYALKSTLGGRRYWAAESSAAVSSVFGRTGAVIAVANDYSATQIKGLGTAAVKNTGTAATQVILGTTLTSHTGDTANPHATTAAQVGAPALSLFANIGSLLRASAVGTAAEIKCRVGLGNLTGAAAPGLTPHAMHSATLTGNVTSWAPTGLADGENAGILLRNPSYTVSTSGLTGWPGYAATSMSSIAQNGAILLIQRAGATYYGVA